MAVRVQREDFDVGAETAKLIDGASDIGAIVTFTGRVRGKDDGRQIAALTLEHYPDMTEAEMARIEAEATARWPLQASLVVHRVGELKAGDNIVLVIAASEHRQARLRGRRISHGLFEDAGAVLEKRDDGRQAIAPGSKPARKTKAPPSVGADFEI